jgi:hypothetical protein
MEGSFNCRSHSRNLTRMKAVFQRSAAGRQIGVHFVEKMGLQQFGLCRRFLISRSVRSKKHFTDLVI